MEMLSGSQISSFLSATSLVWSSSIILLMIGLVYFIKHRERNESIKQSRFFVLYFLTILLNVLEYVINIVMQNNPSYETIIYKFYIFIGFNWNIAIIFYVLNYIRPDKTRKLNALRIIRLIIILLSLVGCVLLDIHATLEINGKFYVLVGTLNTIYNVFAITSNVILIILILWYSKELPKGFCVLCILTFLIYLSIALFKTFSNYYVKENVFMYSLLLLVIFNTTSNQDKELVSKLNKSKNTLSNTNNKINNLVRRLSYQLSQSLNDMVLYNDNLYLSNDYNREFIKKDSKEISNTSTELINYLINFKELYIVESNCIPINDQYNLNVLINNINSKIMPLATSKKINFNINVSDDSYLHYIGDINKIEMAITNILCNVINNIGENQNISLSISGKQHDNKNNELKFTINNSCIINNSDLIKLNLNDLNDNKKEINSNDIKMIISNRLLEIMNSKVDVKTEGNNTIYSFSILQGYKDNELYKKVI